MANRYWVGGTGTWTTTTTNWSASPGGAGGASAPTAADSVFFDQAGTYTVTMTGALNCLDITVSAGTVTFSTGTAPTLAVAGSWSTIAGTVWNATGAITFTTTGSKTITTGGITINGPVTFNNATATWTLQDNLTFGNTLTTTLTAGTLALGSNILTTGLFSSTNSNTRTINFGTGTIALVGSATATVWNTLSRAGLTILGTPNITSSGGGAAVTKTFALGYAPQGSGTYNLSLLETAGSVTYAFTPNDTVNNLTINGLQTVTIPTATNIPALKVYGNYTYANTNGTTTFTGSTAGIVFAGDNETTVDTGGVSTAYPMVLNAGDGKPGVRIRGSVSSTRSNDTGGFVGFPYPAFNQTGSNTYTIEFWINFNSIPTGAASLLQNGRLGASLSVLFSGTTATFRIAHAGFMQYGVNAVFDVPLQEWHHIAIMGNNTNTWIAVNGVVKAFGSLWGEGAYSANGSFPAGRFYSGPHNGDDTIIYNSFGGYASSTYDYYLSQFRIATGTSFIYNTTAFNPPAMPLELTGVTGIACFITNTSNFNDLSASNGVLAVGSINNTVATYPTLEWVGSPPTAPTIRLLNNLNLGASAMHLTNGNIDINSKTVTASSIIIGGGVSTILNTGSSSYAPAMPITHASGTLSLGTNLTTSGATGYTLTRGTLSLGSSTLTTRTFTSSNTNTRIINFGTGKIVLNSPVNNTIWNTAVNTNLTISGTPLVESTGGGGTDDGPGQAVKNINTGTMTEANAISFSFLDTTNFVQYTFANGSVVKNLIFNGSQRVGNYAITVYGSFTHQNTNGTTTFIANTNVWTFAATSGSHNITPVAGYAYDFPWTFNGIGGTWVLQNNLVLGDQKTLTFVNGTLDSSNRTVTGTNGITMTTGTFNLTGTIGTTLSTTAPITHTSGTLNLGTNLTTSNNAGYTLTAGTLVLGSRTLTTPIFSSNNANTRTINFGTGKIVLTFMFSSTIWNTGTVTGLTVSGTPLVECQGGGTALKTINTGVLSAINAISFSLLETTGTVTYAFTASNVVRNLIVNGVQTISNIAITIFGEFTHATTNGTTTFTAGTNAWSFLATSGSYTITPVAGFTYDFPINIGTTGTAATYTLAANLAVGATRQLTLNNGTIDFNNRSIGGNITFSNTNNITLLNTGSSTASWTASITHTAGSLTLPFNLTTTGTTGYTLTAGALNLNGFTLTTSIFNSSTTNTRSIAFGANNIILTTTTAAQVNLGMATANGFTWTGTGGFTAAADITRTFTFGTTGGTANNAPNLTFTGSGAAVQTITTGSWFNILDFGTTAFVLPVTAANLNSLVLSTSGTFTGLSATTRRAGTITPNGKTIAALTIDNITSATTTLTGALGCTTYTQTQGTLDFATFNLTCSGAVTYTAGTLNNIGTITCTTWTCNNTFTLNQGTITPSTSFVVASGGFNYNGGTLSSVPNFTHTNGVVNLNSNLTLAATSTYTFTVGTLNVNNFTLTTGIFSSTNANTRTIIFGTGNILLVHPTAAQTVLAMANATNFNYTGTGGFRTDASVTRTFTFGTTGGTFYNAINLAITSGAEIPTITTNSWIKILDFTGSACTPAASTVNVDTLTLATDGTYTNLIPVFTRTQTWTSQFSKVLGGIGVNRLFNTLTLDGTQTFTTTSVCSLVTGTLDLGGYDLTIGSFSSSGTNIRSVVFGTKNIILNNSVAAQIVLAIADATNFSYSSISGGFVSDASVTRTYQFGSTAGGNIFNAPNLLINSGAQPLTITTQSWFNKLDFTGSTCSSGVATVNISSLTLASGGTYPNLGVIARASGDIISNGKLIAAFTINHSEVGTTRLLGALACTFQSYINGNVDFGGFNLTGSTATYNSGIFSNINVLACTIFTIAGNFELVTGTITPSTSVVLSSGSFRYTGGTLSPVGTFTHTAGTVILNKAYSLTATGTYTLTAGSLNLNNNNLTTGIFSSSGAGVRSIQFGTGNIALAHTTAAQTVLAMADVTNFTWTGTGGFTSAMGVTRTFTFGTTSGTASNAPNLSLTSGASIPTLTNGSWFKNLNFTGSTCTPAVTTINVDTLTLASGGTYTDIVPVFTRTQTWTAQFSKQLGGLGCNIIGGTLTLDNTQTYTATSLFLLNSGTLDLGGYDLTVGRFNSSNAVTTRSILFGSNNIILAHTTAATTVLDVTNATGFTWTGTGGFTAAASVTRTYVFGTTGGTLTNSPNLTFTGSGTAVQTLTTGSWFNKLDFGISAFNPGTISLNLNSLTLSPNGTYTTLTPTMVGVGTIVGNGKTIPTLNINSFNPAVYKVYTFTSSGSLTFPTTNAPPTVDLLLVASGGGGGAASPNNPGGGGGGGIVYRLAQSVLPSTVYPVTVGAGTGGRQQGNDTTMLGLTALGGGMGASDGSGSPPTAGGSGGGGNSSPAASSTGGAGLQPSSASGGFGNKGGNGLQNSNGAGGGGAGGPGGNDATGSADPKLSGGPGLQFSATSAIDGSTRYYSGGGGMTAGRGGVGSGSGNYGGGGHASGDVNGGPGIAIIRYLASYADPLSTTGSPNIASLNLASNPGTVTLNGALTVSGTTTLTNGTLDISNPSSTSITTGTFSSSNTNTRSINYGSNFVYLTGTTALDMTNATNFTCTGTGGFSAAMSAVRTFTFGTTGGTASNAPNLSLTSGASVPTITTGSWFKNLNFTGSTGTLPAAIVRVDTLTLATGGTYTSLIPVFTRTQTWTAQFSKQLGGIGCDIIGGTLTLNNTQTYVATSQAQLFNGVLDLGGSNLTVGTFVSNNSNVREISFGSNNIVLATTTAAALNLDMENATNFAYTGTGGFTAAADITRTFTFGTTGGSSTNALRLTFTGSGTAIPTLTTGSWFDVLNFGTTAFTLAATTLNLDSLTLSSGGTFTNLTANMVGTGTITPNGKTIAALTINHTGTTTLAGALATAATVNTTLTSGTLNLNNFTLTTGAFSSSNTNTRSINFGTGNIVLAHTTASTTVLAMADATNFTYTGTGGFVCSVVLVRSFAFGTTLGGRSTNAPNLSLTGSASNATTIQSGSWFNILDFTGTTISPTTVVNVNSIILATGGTYTGLTVNMVGTGTITPNGKTIAALTVNSNNPLALVPYKVYTFTSTGSITFSSSEAPPMVEYLVVAGGGGGGGGTNSGTGGGGGGAGGLILSSAQMLSGTSYPVVVGAGGGGVNLSSGTKGTNSSFNGSVAIGGGYGARRAAGGSGGSGGGGGGGGGVDHAGGAGTPGQGNGGGSSASAESSGGGGGAGAAALPAVGSVASSGGIGLSLTISGAATYYAGGGGGGASAGGTAGAAGLGGGGAGKVGVIGDADDGEPGTANTGGGGGAGGGNLSGGSIGGAGGSGIVIIRYLASYADPLSTTGSPIVSTIMDSSPVASPATDDVVTLNGALTTSGTTTLTLGQLNLNNFTLTTGGLSSSNTNVRAIAFGSGNIALTGTAALAMADATNFTYTGTGNLTSAMSAIRTFTFGSTAGGSASNAMNLSLTSGASIPTLTVGSWFKVLNFTGTTSTPAVTTVYVDTLTLATGGTYTGLTPIFTRTQTWTSQFSKVLDGIGFNLVGGTLTLNGTQTYSATGSFNLMAGTLDLGGANLTVGRFISNNSSTRAISFGSNNIVLATTVAATLNLDILGSTGFTWTGTGGFVAAADLTRTYVFGTTGGTSTNAPNLAFTGSGTAIQTIVTGSWFNNLNFGTTIFAVPNTTINVSTLTLSSAGTYTGLIPLFTTTQTWTPQHSKALGGIGVNTSGVTLTLGSSQVLTRSSTVIVNAGTLNLNNIGLECYNFSSTSTGSRSITGGEINVNNNWTVVDGAGFNASGSTVNMIAITGKTFAGGGGSYGTLVQKSEFPLLITGSNSFESLQVSSDMIDSTVVSGEAVYTTPGTFSWIAPAGVTNVSVVAVGGGGRGGGGVYLGGGAGGGGGGLGWKNNISVTPGQSYTVVVGAGGAAVTQAGGSSYFISTSTVAGFGGQGGGVVSHAGGTYVGDGGGNGGAAPFVSSVPGGGGGAGGYSGTGGTGAGGTEQPTAGTGGGGGGGGADWNQKYGGKAGGGVGIFGQGTNGAAGVSSNLNSNVQPGGAGSSGSGILYGGGGASLESPGASGAVRLIWGYERNYPLASPATIDFMIVGGGAGSLNLSGAGDSNAGIGGAGAGGVVIQNQYPVPPIKSTGNSQTIVVTVGSGGTPNGSNTTLTSADGLVSFTALGGGLPGVYIQNGGAGGSGGGGGGRDYPPGNGGAGLQPASASGGYGNNGGRCRTGNNGGGSAAGGGGGGAGAVGSDGVQQLGGAGGIGIESTMLSGAIAQDLNIGEISSSTGLVYFAGGGGGMANGTGGAGGLGGGGRGASSAFQGTGVITNTQSNATGVRNGKANTGGGAGGAAGFANYGGTGGSGVVIIRELRTIKPPATVTGGCTIIYDGIYILYVFKSSGTITFIN
jgi:hypothetical protein